MAESAGLTGDVNPTALAVAACRAVEASRPDALVADRFAAAEYGREPRGTAPRR